MPAWGKLRYADAPAALQEVAADKFIQERFVPKLVAAGITLMVDIVRKPGEHCHPGMAIVKTADQIDAALIVICPHEHEFVEVCCESVT